jgi:hypothetical protein
VAKGHRAAESTSRNNLGQFIVQGRYRNKESVPDSSNKGSFFEQESGGTACV